MAQRVRDILLRISGDASDAERALEELDRELKDLDATEVEATVDVNTEAAQAKIEATTEAVEDFGRLAEEAKIDLQTAGAEAQLERLQQNLERLQARASEPKIDIAIGKTIAQIERVEAQLDKLDRRRVDIEVDVDVDRDRLGGLFAGGIRGIAGTIAGGISSAAQGLGLLVASASRGIPVIGGLGQLLVQLGLSGAALAPIFLAAAAALSLAMIPAMALAAGAAIALVASLGSAAIAVGVLGTALAAAFGPVALVGIAAMARFEKVLEAVTADADKLKEALQGLTPAERSLALALRDLKEAVTGIFRPATNAIFRGMADALKDLAAFARDPRVRSGFTAIGRAIGDMFRAFGRELRRPGIRDAFRDFAQAGVQIIRRLTPVFTGLFNLIIRLAQVALPFLLNVIGDIGRAFRAWARDVDRSDLDRFVRRVRNSFRAWLGVAKELVLIVKALFVGSAKDGDRLATTIRDILRRFRLWLEEDPKRITDFFKTSVDFAIVLLDVLTAIVGKIQQVIELANKIPSPVRTGIGRGIREGVGRALPWPFNLVARQTGGLIPGSGSGDIVPAMLEPGEYVIRRSVAQAIGVGRLNLLNAGNIAALGGGRGGVNIEKIILPPAPGHNQMGDPRHQAAQFARELRRRGEVGLSGGGFP